MSDFRLGAALVGLQSGFRLEYIWESAVPFDPSP